uniref:Uncharacterized protein n=1 Tax=Racemicystis crocea TaxID=1707966 RepID=A0A3S7V0K9_9BACT|nr:hypothetical protein [Racemicystis crocea]
MNDGYTCSDPGSGRIDPTTGEPAPCPSSATVRACEGQCVPKGPTPWSTEPTLLWIGQGTPPKCPEDRAPDIGFEGFADPESTFACDTCKCAPPTGSCVLPTTMTVSSEACPGDGPTATHTSFDAPADWGGGCTSANGIPAGQTCGAGPCVKSLTIDPPMVKEADCAVVVEPVPKLSAGEITFKQRARECLGSVSAEATACDGQNAVCVVSAEPPPPGFHQCIWREGEISDDCPKPYAERHVFYQRYDDQRTCTPCACDKPVGSVCTAQIALYEDAACATMFEVASVSSTNPPKCQDLISGSALLSKAALNEKYKPGACQPSGGQPDGALVLESATTFCCMPSAQ